MIGVYDSGYGGLTVLRELQKELPTADFVFLGDSGRAPYGGRDAHAILDLAEQCVERLFEEGCRVIVVACHTVSCVGLRHLQQHYANEHRRILGVTIPAAEAAVARRPRSIAWLGTNRTIHSRTYEVEIHKLDPALPVHGIAAPLLAPLVEEGLGNGADSEGQALTRLAVRRYLRKLPPETDCLVLGCTHYPLLSEALLAELPAHIHLLDPAPVVARALSDWLRRHPEFQEPGTGQLRVLCSGDPVQFQRQGSRFLGRELPTVQHISEEGGRLAHRSGPPTPSGQVVRGFRKR